MPECADCGEPSFGAQFLAYVSSLGPGRHAWVARFVCEHCKGDRFLAMLCANLNQWRLHSRTEQGVYGIRKLSESEQNIRALKARERTR